MLLKSWISATMAAMCFPVSQEASKGARKMVDTDSYSASIQAEPPRYCRSDAQVLRVEVPLRVRVVNRATRRLIVARTFGAPLQVKVATTVAAAQAGEFVFEFVGTELLSGEGTTEFGALPDAKQFVSLDEGRSHEAVVYANVLARHSKGRAIEGVLELGKPYVFQVVVPLWPARGVSLGAIEELTARWGPYGLLVSRETSSDWIQLRLLSDPVVERCDAS